MGALKVFNGSTWEYIDIVTGVTIGTAAPSGPAVGQLWLDTDDSDPDISGGAGTLRNIASVTGTSAGTIYGSGVEFNGGQVNVPLRTNRRYRGLYKAAVVPDTAGMYSRNYLRYDPTSSITGTNFATDYTDHRTNGRVVSITVVGEFTWTGADFTDMNINAVLSGQAGGLSVYSAVPWALFVDEYRP